MPTSIDLTPEELEAIATRRALQDTLFIGIDHHAAQLTVAVARGRDILESPERRNHFAWVPTRVFVQDALGYLALLDYLAEQYPDIERGRYVFLSEPSYAKPCSHFLLNAGFERAQVLWADTRHVSHYRKAHHFGNAGKNDPSDARTLLAMLFRKAHDTAAHLKLVEVPVSEPTSEALSQLAEEHRRLSEQTVVLKNKLFQLILLLFPELRRVFGRVERAKKPDGTSYERLRLALFDSRTPLRVLYHFPSAAAVRQAGFEGLWRVAGGSGVSKAPLRRLVEVCGASAGLDNALWSRQLTRWIDELWELERRMADYEQEMEAIIAQDAVLVSFKQIKYLSTPGLATLLGALGDARRYVDADQMKRSLNVAPVPLPQSGEVDERGKPVQKWRFPANSYEYVNGQKKLRYESPGRKDVRQVGYLWFELQVRGQSQHPDSPFIQLYQRLKSKHQGQPRWLGRVRWKVVSKLVETIYYCLKFQRPFDPSKLAVQTAKAAA